MSRTSLGIFGTLLIILLGILAIALPIQAQNETVGWSSPEIVGPGWWQSLAVDVQGRVHIGFYSGIEEGLISRDLFSYRTREMDGEWSDLNPVIHTANGGFTVRNSLVATTDGIIHALYRAGDIIRYGNAPIGRSNSAVAWSLTKEFASGYYLDMTSDQANNLHVVTSSLEFLPNNINLETNPCAICKNLVYRRSINGGRSWSQPVVISGNPTAGSDRPDIFQGMSGRIYIVWDEGFDWNAGRGNADTVNIVYSEDGGQTWSDQIVLDGGNLDDRRPIQGTMTELRDGSLLAVWRYFSSRGEDINIYYQTSTDAGITWTDPKAIPNITARGLGSTPLDDYELITDQLGTAHLFAVGYRPGIGGNPILFHLEYDNNQWQSAEAVFYSPLMRPEWPKAAIGPENDIHLTWFVRSLAEDDLRIDPIGLKVFYSHRQGTLLERSTPTFSPTITPLPTITPFVLFNPTLTPLPHVPPITQVVRADTTDNYDGAVVLGGFMASIVFCGLVLAIVRFSPWR